MTTAPPGRSLRTGLVLGHIRAVPILVTPSWLLAAILLAAIYRPVIHSAVTGISATGAYLSGAGFAVLFGICVLAHELAHTGVSIALGHPVRRVVLFALGGVSEVDGEPERARDELLIAGSGPAVSLLIAGAAWLGYDAAPVGALSTALLGLLCWSNLLLAAFNLLPGLPLDGGRLLRAAARGLGARPATATRVAAWSGRVVAVGAVPPERRPCTPVTTVARPLEPGLLVPDGIDAAGLLRHMEATPSHEYLVVRPDGGAAGIIATRDFARRLTAKAAP